MDTNYDWPGWPLADNPHGTEFDLAARKRMVAGSKLLSPYLDRYKDKMGPMLLEVGPFFNPLLSPEAFPGKDIFFWENDYHVLKWLHKEYEGHRVYPVFCNLNNIEGASILKLFEKTDKAITRSGNTSMSFSTIIISHVLNYIDYQLFFLVLKDYIKKDGYIFINNVIEYGLPVFFSDKRPKKITEIIRTLKAIGYKIIEKEVIESPDKEFQKQRRLILVAQLNE